jgi:hypothetical protein
MVCKKFNWFKKEENHWLGILELNGHLAPETYRINILRKQFNDNQELKFNFYEYKFERFLFSSRSWTLDITKSNYFVSVFSAIRTAYLEHINEVLPENILITFTQKSESRLKIYHHYFHPLLLKKNYSYYESIQLTYCALLFFKEKKLIEKQGDKKLNLMLDSLFSKHAELFA